MKLIDYINLGHNSFQLLYQNETSDNYQWEMFHAHQGIEFHYIHQGTGHIVLDQKIHRIKTKTLICYQPYQLHKINMETHPLPYIRTTFVFDPVFVEKFLKPFPSLYSFFLFLWKERLPFQIIELPEHHKVLDLFADFHRRLEMTNENEHKEELILFLISFFRYVREFFQPGLIAASSQKRVTRHSEMILEWIDRHYKEEFNLDRLAAELHLSPYHISHLFREDMGCSITEYIIVKRLKEACFLLATSSLSIKEISKQIGLNSDSYFCHMFKKHMGVSPNQYRSQSKKAFANK
jgi:AraC-like DNA-binding protein